MISYKEVTVEEIAAVLAKMGGMKNTRKPNINGRMLWCAANLVFLAGAKESEIRWFKVKNVFTGGDIVNPIKVCWKSIIKPIALSDRVKEILRDYIRYLQTNKPELDADSPLFSEYFGRNSKRDFLTDLEEFSLKFKELRRIGAGNYYRTLIKNGIHQDAAEKETATQFRIVEGEGLETDREPYIIYETPKKSVIKAGLRSEQKEREEEEKLQGIGEVRFSPESFREREERKRKRIEGPKRSFGIIEEVDAQTRSTVVTMRKSKKKVTFPVQNEAKITEGKKQLSFAQLKKGMNVSIVERFEMNRRVAIAINVYKPTGSKGSTPKK